MLLFEAHKEKLLKIISKLKSNKSTDNDDMLAKLVFSAVSARFWKTFFTKYGLYVQIRVWLQEIFNKYNINKHTGQC